MLVGEPEFPDADDRELARDKPLGTGGFGETYLARDAAGRAVVVKELLQRHENWYRARFAFEAQTLIKLSHRSIPRVQRFGKWRTSGRLFFVMEYVEGVSLTEKLEALRLSRDAKPEPQAAWTLEAPNKVGYVGHVLDLVLQLASMAHALVHAHRAGIVHRDVKPPNIIIRTEDGVAVLIDWGIAGAVDVADTPAPDNADAEKGVVTRGGAGSAFYLSPEQANAEPPKPAMDVWGVGAIVYEVLAGHPPFRDQLPANPQHLQARAAALSKTPTPLTSIDPALRELAELALRCLARDPSARPTTTELAEKLTSISRNAVCSQCGAIASRTSTHVCDTCSGLDAFDAVYGLTKGAAKTRPAPIPNSPVLVSREMTPAALSAGASSDLSDLVPTGEPSVRAGVRTTPAKDQLRDVSIEELEPSATDAERSAFETARTALATTRRGFPAVVRMGDGRFVLEQLMGAPVSALARDSDPDVAKCEALSIALATFARSVLALHRDGFAHGGLGPDQLLVRFRGSTECEIVAPHWRAISKSMRDHTDVFAKPDPAQNADLTAVVVLASHVAKVLNGVDRFASVERVIAGVAVKRFHVASEVEQIVTLIDGATRKVACHRCGELHLPIEMTIAGMGYSCLACLSKLGSGPGLGLDVHFTVGEQRQREARHRKVFWRSLVATVLLGLVHNVFGGGLLWFATAPIYYGALAISLFHVARANDYRDHRVAREQKRNVSKAWQWGRGFLVFVAIWFGLAIAGEVVQGMIVQSVSPSNRTEEANDY